MRTMRSLFWSTRTRTPHRVQHPMHMEGETTWSRAMASSPVCGSMDISGFSELPRTAWAVGMPAAVAAADTSFVVDQHDAVLTLESSQHRTDRHARWVVAMIAQMRQHQHFGLIVRTRHLILVHSRSKLSDRRHVFQRTRNRAGLAADALTQIDQHGKAPVFIPARRCGCSMMAAWAAVESATAAVDPSARIPLRKLRRAETASGIGSSDMLSSYFLEGRTTLICIKNFRN